MTDGAKLFTLLTAFVIIAHVMSMMIGTLVSKTGAGKKGDDRDDRNNAGDGADLDDTRPGADDRAGKT